MSPKGRFGNVPLPCACGCGQLAELDGYGRARKFLVGHRMGANNPSWGGGKISLSAGYVGIRNQKHPRSIAGGYVLEHVLMAERALGHPLPEGAPVHHVNGIVHDNRPGNLVICQDQAYHMVLHRRQRALENCGNANWWKCRICKQYDDPKSLVIQWSLRKERAHHAACLSRYNREFLQTNRESINARKRAKRAKA